MENGKVIKETQPDTNPNYPNTPPKLFIHDVITNKSQEVTFEDAQQLKLLATPLSLDEFEIVDGTHSQGLFPLFVFSSTDYSTKYLKKQAYRKKLALNLTSSYYRDFHFLGWIVN